MRDIGLIRLTLAVVIPAEVVRPVLAGGPVRQIAEEGPVESGRNELLDAGTELGRDRPDRLGVVKVGFVLGPGWDGRAEACGLQELVVRLLSHSSRVCEGHR